MDELKKYIEGKLKAAKSYAEQNDKDARYYAHTFESHAYGAVEFFCYQNWQTKPELTQQLQELWEDEYRPQFEILIFGA